jgi:hypothetical protein
MRLLTVILSLLLSPFCFSQQVIDVSKQDVRVGSNIFFVSGGEPFVTTKFVNLVEGTPYFKDEWLKGLVVDKSNHEYKDIQLKIDLMANTVHYLGENEKEFVATTTVKEIVLTDAAGDNYRFVHSSGLETVVNVEKGKWYLWLASGTASLYKKFEKDLTEFKGYGSATTEQRIKTHEKYVILYNNSFLEVKKIKDVPSILAAKKKELEAFLKTKDDDKASMDDRMVKLIEYYNSLVIEKKS